MPEGGDGVRHTQGRGVRGSRGGSLHGKGAASLAQPQRQAAFIRGVAARKQRVTRTDGVQMVHQIIGAERPGSV